MILQQFLVIFFLFCLPLSTLAAPGSTLDPQLGQVLQRLYVRHLQPGYVDHANRASPFAAPDENPKDTAAYITQPVQQTMNYPWFYTGLLLGAEGSSGVAVCTATLVSPRVVVTAAHCLFNRNQQVLPELAFYPAFNRGQATLGKAKAVKTFLVNTYRGPDDNNHDIAFVMLDQPPIPPGMWRNLPRLRVGVVDDRHFRLGTDTPLAVVVAGYPAVQQGQPGGGSLWLSATTTYRNAAPADKDRQFEHKAFSPEGTSGGPVLAWDPLYRQFALVGVVSSHRTYSDGEAWAVAVRMGDREHARLRQIVQMADGSGW